MHFNDEILVTVATSPTTLRPSKVILSNKRMFRVVLASGLKVSKIVSVPSAQNFARALSTRYTPSHEYVRLEGDIATVGITDFAAAALGDVVFVDLPSVGTKFSAGDSFGSVESVKAASDVYSPVAGQVVDVNSDLEETPARVNESPFEKGWFMKIKLGASGKSEFDKLLDETAYKAHTSADQH